MDPVVYSEQLHANAPLGVTIARTNVVLFRAADGTPRALLDRCPHRGAAPIARQSRRRLH